MCINGEKTQGTKKCLIGCITEETINLKGGKKTERKKKFNM